MEKLSSSPSPSLCDSRNKGGDFLNGLVGHALGDGRSIDALKIGDGKNALHDGSVWCQHDVVLVHAKGVVALRLQHTDDAERRGAETDDASNGVLAVGEEVVGNGFANHANLRARLDIFLREHLSVFNFELTDFQIVGRDAIHGRRRVVVAIDKLPGGIDRRTNG